MTGNRHLRFALFALELPRLALVLVAVSGYGAGASASHAAAFAAPHSLFVLMALFSWLQPEKGDVFRPVFTAGKLVSGTALSVWLAGAVPAVLASVRVAEAGPVVSLIAAVATAGFDLLEGLALAIASLKRPKSAPERELPALVVDDLPEDGGSER